MPKASTKRVQCPDPNCQKIQKTRGSHYFVCDGCGLTFDIEPNRFEQGDNSKNGNSEHRETDGQDSGRHKSEGDMGQTGRQGTGGGKDREQPPKSSLEGDTTESEDSDRLEFG